MPYSALAQTHTPRSFFVAQAEIEGRPLHRGHFKPDPDRAEIVNDRLPHGEIRRELVQFPSVKAVGIAGLSQQLFRLGWIVGIRLEGQRELEVARHDAPGEL